MKDFNKKEIMKTITPVVENTAMRYGLIPIEITLEKENNKWFLRIFIFNPKQSVSHKDCENISRSLGDMLDELIPFKYYLEVSSPGLDRKFKDNREYIIFKGHDVIIKLKNKIEGLEIEGKTLSAKLIDYSENSNIKVLFDEKEIIIPLENIHSTRLNDKIEINKIKENKYD